MKKFIGLSITTLVFYSVTSFSKELPAEERRAVQRVMKCSLTGTPNEKIMTAYYKVAEEGEISPEQSTAISRVLNRVVSCKEVQIVLESVLASKSK